MNNHFIKFSTLSITCLLFSSCTGQQKTNFGKVLKQAADQVVKASTGVLSEDEVGMGLKEALVQGISKGSDSASKKDGFFLNPAIKILLPPDIQRAETALRKIGLGPQVDNFLMTLNRGAEDAASQAKPIFISAIKQLTIKEAFNILKGNQDAATVFLRNTTEKQLFDLFGPVIEKSLEKTQATKNYTDLANRYNQIPFVQKINPDLKAYATQKALDGLFLLIAKEEKLIREDPIARTSDILKRVFGSK